MLSVGDQAPAFTLPDQHGNQVSLEVPGASWIAVYFYPAASTPGCTAQACDIRDRWGELVRAGIRVLGISTDSQEAVSRFASEQGLVFPLLCDPEGSVCEAWGVLRGKRASRTTFLLGPDFRVAHVFEDVDTQKHVEQLLGAAQENSGG